MLSLTNILFRVHQVSKVSSLDNLDCSCNHSHPHQQKENMLAVGIRKGSQLYQSHQVKQEVSEPYCLLEQIFKIDLINIT